MKKLSFHIFGLLLGFSSLYAQTSLSLEQALLLANQNRAQLRSDQLAQEIAQTQIREAYLKRYPQVNIQGDYRVNAIRATTVFPAGTFGANTPETQRKLGTILSQTAAVDVTQPLYDRKIRFEVKQAELNAELASISPDASENEIAAAVIKSYLNVLVNRARKVQLAETHKRFEADLLETKNKVEGGTLPKIEQSRIENSLSNLIQQMLQQEESILLSEMLLRYYVGLKADEKIVLTDALSNLQSDLDAAKGDLSFLDPSKVPAIRQQQLQVRIAQNQIDKLHAKLYPTVSAYGYLGVQGFGNKLDYFGTNAIPWFGVSYLGLRLNWNLSGYWENKVLVPQQLLRISQAEEAIKIQEENLRIAVANAESSVRRALFDIEIARNNENFARENIRYIRDRYELGAVTLREVVDAENGLSDAQANSLIASLNVLTAYFDLKKAKGELSK